MNAPIIDSDEQYRKYQVEIEALATQDPKHDSVDGVRLAALATLVENYEKDRFPFGHASADS
jgi:antitoxin component HigA of HigAB toxin-antitoxin module